MLEVIASSVADAVAAEAGGAARLELVRDLDRGGLTPPRELIQDVLAAVRIPVRVMLREEEDFFLNEQKNPKKLERLCALARSLADLSLDGLVLGFLTGQRSAPQIHHAALAQVLANAPGFKATFHRAFELLRDSVHAAHELRRHPQIDRILTSGNYPDLQKDWPQRLTGLVELARQAPPPIKILVGGGVERETIAGLCQDLCQEKLPLEFHVGRAVRQPYSNTGTVQARLVREVVALMRQPKSCKAD